ncbi:hypothetical protein [Streptomyces inusitatus]|uniref:hypothetical protein n=1 Tax=Streptomyces inusitatus TaxID=68221 RepID=UPI00167C77B0|nr:hypothetical protein [Streptomyces inusitatus]
MAWASVSAIAVGFTRARPVKGRSASRIITSVPVSRAVITSSATSWGRLPVRGRQSPSAMLVAARLTSM